MKVTIPSSCIFTGQAVIRTEQEALAELETRIDQSFEDACQHILKCKGRVIVLGIGKSGHIGRKIAATFTSTGTPAFFVHPTELNHGDLGIITAQDVLLIISYSGETVEVVDLLPHLKRLNCPMIAMSSANSTLANAADINLNIEIHKEAGKLGLAPTTSTTVTLALGDALAIAVSEAKGFGREDFSVFHPGGTLGKYLLLQVDHIMHKDIPCVNENTRLDEALIEITQKRLGMTVVVNNEGKLIGIYTDGDIRRSLQNKVNFHDALIKDQMSRGCKTISGETKAADALAIMEQHKITSLVIIDTEHRPIGVLHLHDLLQLGFSTQ